MKPEIFEQKRIVARIFKSRCFVCHRKFGKGFTFHHKWYVQGEKTYRDFKNPNEYTLYILEIVKKNPEQFLLLCKKHHVLIEWFKRYSPQVLTRLLKAVRMSREMGQK